jgi:hypothetical protein
MPEPAPQAAPEATQTPPAAPAAAAAPTTPPGAPAAPETPPAEKPAEDVASLPEWAQKLLAKTRTEAASNRTKATEQATALQATRDAIAKALGLQGEEDPVAAAKTATEQRDAAMTEARTTRIENAVLRSAGKHGADPEALTDSRSFMRTLEGIDPAANDFADQVDAAIKGAVEANPGLLKAGAPAPARSGGPVGGGAPVPGQLTKDDLKRMTPEEIAKAKDEGRCNALLGIT